MEKQEKRTKATKINLKNEVPDVVTGHWDGKLSSVLEAKLY